MKALRLPSHLAAALLLAAAFVVGAWWAATPAWVWSGVATRMASMEFPILSNISRQSLNCLAFG